MSTTSTATASVARDQIPSHEIDLLNCMCILVLTRGNGTAFDAASIQEEDIIKICVWLGQTHPKGVLWYSVVESVMLFHSTGKMQVVACGIIKTMTLHKEPIKVRTSPLSAAHVRVYMAIIDGQPSGAQHPAPDGEGNPQQSPSDCHLGGSTPCQLQANLWDFVYDEL